MHQLGRLWLAALALAAGCAASFEDAANGQNPCGFQACPTANVAALGAEIVASGVGAQEFSTVPYDTTHGVFQLETAPTVKLSGRLKIPAELGVAPLKKATIVATRPSRLPGRPDVSAQALLSDSGDYELLLLPNLPGEHYTLRASIDATLLPPLVVDVVVTQDAVLDLVPIAPASSPAITGQVHNTLGLPMVGIEVVGRDPETGAIVTTRNATDAAGKFELRLGSVGKEGVRLEATIDETLRLERLVSVASSTSQNENALVLQLPALPNAATQTVPLVGPSPAGIDVPVTGAQVIARTRIQDPSTPEVTAVHQQSGFSDAQGKVQLSLYAKDNGPRTYTFDVVTLGNSEFQSIHTEIEAGRVEGYLGTVTLVRRPALFGKIYDSLGQPVQGATIEPRQRAAFLATGDSLAGLVPPTTVTDADGKYTLHVDPGLYEFAVTPRVADALPRYWIPELEVTEQRVLPEVHLPRAAHLVGRLVNQAAPLPNVTVRFYELPDNSLCDGTDAACVRSARLQAEGTSRSDGTLDVILPATN